MMKYPVLWASAHSGVVCNLNSIRDNLAEGLVYLLETHRLTTTLASPQAFLGDEIVFLPSPSFDLS